MAEGRISSDLQAKITLQAARDVAFSLDQTLKSARHAAASPSALSGKALETTERLFNLLDLLSSWLEVVGPGLHDDLATGIAVLRDKALPVGVRLIGQRARRILRRGEHAASGADGFPVGISLALAESVAGLRTSVDSLGGMENIPDELRTTIDRTYKVIETLIELENRHGVFREFEIGPARDIFD